jgi:hypothetical protein
VKHQSMMEAVDTLHFCAGAGRGHEA